MDTAAHTDENSLNIQNEYFNNARKNRTRITVFLTNGQRITGFIRSFDKFTVILDTRTGDQMVFKHAITSVATALPMDRDVRGPRPQRPGMGERGDARHSGGPPRPPHAGPGEGPPRDAGTGGPPHREPGAARSDADSRPRGAAGPQGKSFGNFMDLSAVKKSGATASAPPGPGAVESPAGETGETGEPAAADSTASASPDPDGGASGSGEP
jgi:host factor-I protein